jgi:hypothetical protein
VAVRQTHPALRQPHPPPRHRQEPRRHPVLIFVTTTTVTVLSKTTHRLIANHTVDPTANTGATNRKTPADGRGWRTAIVEIGRPKMRLHDLRHIYASLARRAGADPRLLQKTGPCIDHRDGPRLRRSLYDDELDVVASALDALDDRPSQ